MLRAYAWVFAFVVAGPSFASAPPASESTDCPALFGGEGARSHNSALRAYELDEVRHTPEGASVIHHIGKWRAAVTVNLTDLRVLDVDTRSGRAQIEIAEGHAACPAGIYEVAIDDSVGKDAHVLALVEDGVLVATDDALWVVPVSGKKPNVELVWRSHYAVLATVPPAASAKGARRSATAGASPAAAAKADTLSKPPKRPKTPRPPKSLR